MQLTLPFHKRNRQQENKEGRGGTLSKTAYEVIWDKSFRGERK